MHEENDDIEVILKPMNITEIHKREVKMSVSKYQLVGDLAQTLVNIMGLKEAQAGDANFLYLGKTLNHSQSFYEQNVSDQTKIILTLKRRVPAEQPKPKTQPISTPPVGAIPKP
jgi:hypothetical protein